VVTPGAPPTLPRATADPAILVQNLTVRAADRPVLSDISFRVEPGELVVLVGENGAGKSTLVGALAGVIRPDRGQVSILGRAPQRASDDLAVVWQEPALFEDMRVVDNLFLGRELGGVFLRHRKMRSTATGVLFAAGFAESDLNKRVSELSAGQRQILALSRAVMADPKVLILDEPTAALGVAEQTRFDRLLSSLRSRGVTIVLISHRVEQVVALADRVLALRHGRLVVEATTVELTTDDIVALMSGLASGSTARRHLTQLSDLVEQLGDVEPAASVPLIVSAIANTLGQQQLCVHLVDPEHSERLVIGASVGISPARAERFATVAIDASTTIGDAFLSADVRIRESVEGATQPSDPEPASVWSVPIVGNGRVYGVISGLADIPGRPKSDQLEVASLYGSFAASALEREQNLRDLTRHNKMLESLHRVLDVMAAHDPGSSSVIGGLEQLQLELGSKVIAACRLDRDGALVDVTTVDAAGGTGDTLKRLGVDEHALGVIPVDRVEALDARTVGISTTAEPGYLVIVVSWDVPIVAGETADLIRNVAWSLALSVEREQAQLAITEARATERTSALQREFVHRLSHELRTPLTTILGYASTLRQPDVTWTADRQNQFIDLIGAESARMHRLVKDLLDSSTLAAGRLPLVADWCDVELIMRAAASTAGADAVVVEFDAAGVPPVWADHDRLEQVLINVIENSLRHGAHAVQMRASAADGVVSIHVIDDGPGVEAAGEELFDAYVNGSTSRPGLGLGLAISRGIMDAHGGSIGFVPVEKGADVVITLPVEGSPQALSAGATHG
jgi:ABC-type multidrug transport system ATPase subunit/signal transduction histidine kinase